MDESKYYTLSEKLAIKFTEELYIPERFKRKLKNKSRLNTDKEINWNKIVKKWIVFIDGLYKNLDSNFVDRVVNFNPIIDSDSFTNNKDFIEFTDYFIKRRDLENCDNDELGKLAMLHTALQQTIEKKNISSSNTTLKNNNAQELMEKGSIIVDGIEVDLWRGHTKNNVYTNHTWNKIVSYAEINEKSTGIAGNIVFTGIMQIERKEIAEYAAKLGFKVNASPSPNTDFIVVGSENVGPNKIAKYMELKEKGHDIKLVDENTFLEIVAENLEMN